MPNGDTTAELTRRINPIQPRRTTQPRRGKIWEWAEHLENLASWWCDISPLASVIALMAILTAIAASHP